MLRVNHRCSRSVKHLKLFAIWHEGSASLSFFLQEDERQNLSVIAAVALFGNAHHLGLEDFVLQSALVVLNKPLFELVNNLRRLFVVHHIQPRNLANQLNCESTISTFSLEVLILRQKILLGCA